MTFIPTSLNPEAPPTLLGYWTAGVTALNGGQILVPNTYLPGYDLFLDGITMTCTAFTAGANGRVQIASPVYVGGGVYVFQAFVYSSSQATFSWSGHVPMIRAFTLEATVPVGEFDIVCWGTYSTTSAL